MLPRVAQRDGPLRPKEIPQLLSFLIGLCLCSAIPLFKLGPSFILWPSACEVSGVLLLILAGYRLGRLRFYRMPDPFVWILVSIAVLYVLGITIFLTLNRDYALTYPGWSCVRFVQWIVTGLGVLFCLSPKEIRYLSYGILAGGLMNALVAIPQRLGLMNPADLVAHISGFANAGPWATIYELNGPISGEGIGIFSFSRIATGFLIAVALFVLFQLRPGVWAELVASILLIAGILCTGGRTGAVCAAIILVGALAQKKRLFVILSLIAALLVVVGATQLTEDPVVGRVFGKGNEDIESAIEGRTSRQFVVFSLPSSDLIFGCGLGNLGSALGFDDENFPFYRAHGFFFTYLGEVGIVGILLCGIAIGWFILKSAPPRGAWVFLLALGAVGLSDDFLIPSSTSAHLPLMAAIALRLALHDRSSGCSSSARNPPTASRARARDVAAGFQARCLINPAGPTPTVGSPADRHA